MGTSSNAKRVQKRYSQAFKREVVGQIESGAMSVAQARRRYGLGRGSTVYDWLRRYGKYNHEVAVMRIEKPGEVDRIKELEKRKQELETALADAHLEILKLRSTVKAAKDEYGIDLAKKNSGTNRSSRRS